MTHNNNDLADIVAANWNANADQWTADVGRGADLYRDLFTWPAFATFLGDVGGLDIIDFGCGEGTNTRKLARAGARMTGIDLSSGMVANAQAAEAADPLGIAYHIGSFSSPTPFKEKSFDRVVSTLALMDGPDLPGAMQEAHRLLKPGGEIAFSVLHPCHVTSGGIRWISSGTGGASGLVIDKYHNRQPFTDHWQFNVKQHQGDEVKRFKVLHFPRTLADWVNAITATGLVLTRVEEPIPTDAAIAQHPILQRWREHAAFLLLVRARKPH